MSPVSVPRTYPVSCSETELVSIIQALTTEMLNTGPNINDVLRIGPLISIGQTELQRRLADRSSKELREAMENFRDSSAQSSSELQEGISRFSTASSSASKTLIRLTGVLVVLTVVLVMATIVLFLHDPR